MTSQMSDNHAATWARTPAHQGSGQVSRIDRFRCTGMTGGPPKIIASANGCTDSTLGVPDANTARRRRPR
jgi:hypothetical protein